MKSLDILDRLKKLTEENHALRERINSLNNEVTQKNLKIASLEGHINLMSCCCALCTKHNDKLKPLWD